MKKGTIAYINHEREQIKKGAIEAQEAFVNKFAEMNNIQITTIVTSFNELLTAVFSDKYDLMIIADYGALLDDENNVGLLVQFEKAGVKVCSTMCTLESNKSLYKKYLKAKKEMGDTPYSKEKLKDLVKLFTAYDEIEDVSLKKSEEQVDELTEANKNQLRAVIFYHPCIIRLGFRTLKSCE